MVSAAVRDGQRLTVEERRRLPWVETVGEEDLVPQQAFGRTHRVYGQLYEFLEVDEQKPAIEEKHVAWRESLPDQAMIAHGVTQGPQGHQDGSRSDRLRSQQVLQCHAQIGGEDAHVRPIR